MATFNAIKILRHLISEVRHVTTINKLSDSLQMQYILSQYKKNRTTDLQLCKAHEEMKFMAHTYLCYLTSLKNYHKIQLEYKGKGERTFEDTAKLVGFKLPHDPK